jgi:UDP-N-acetylglucosamine acyltransferase
MAFISASCLVHQFTRIGTLAMIAGGVRLNKDFPPYMSTGNDNIVTSYNVVGLKRAGLDSLAIGSIKQAHRILYRQNLSTQHALAQLESVQPSAEVQHLIQFIRQSKRGVCAARSNRNI